MTKTMMQKTGVFLFLLSCKGYIEASFCTTLDNSKRISFIQYSIFNTQNQNKKHQPEHTITHTKSYITKSLVLKHFNEERKHKNSLSKLINEKNDSKKFPCPIEEFVAIDTLLVKMKKEKNSIKNDKIIIDTTKKKFDE